ncbi:allantoinase [Sporolactobacillus inulinus]|uniref:Allantoinase n=1 Tax=Sporolactobacillus inulinus TaxID=2078 RepID=A0A4Y1ZGS5_9BACL|nr:allantoinase [Sporolactobacillus inulinus]
MTDQLLQGQIDLISSDHSPCEWKDKDKENLFEAWGGISGGQFSLLSAIEIALDHEISLTKVAEWTARHPAERFGLSARKGSIGVGKDADLAIVDLNQSERVTRERLLQRNAFSLYEGRIFPAKVLTTINRGTVVYSEGKINSSARGRWISAKA